MKHAYGSLNKVLQTVWTATAPGKTLHFERPEHPTVIGPDCLLVQWIDAGSPTSQPNEYEAMVQLDIFVSNRDRATALGWASEIDRLLGFQSEGGFGQMGRFDWTDPDVPVYLTDMRIEPYETGWLAIPDPNPKLIHYARTIVATFLVN